MRSRSGGMERWVAFIALGLAAIVLYFLAQHGLTRLRRLWSVPIHRGLAPDAQSGESSSKSKDSTREVTSMPRMRSRKLSNSRAKQSESNPPPPSPSNR